MTELSIEQKAKAYDEALKVLHKYDGANIMFTQDLKEEMFPELKESEDEKIRKAIHIYLDWLDGRKDYEPKGIYSIKDMIAWLEKQGEQQNNSDVKDYNSIDPHFGKPISKVEPKFNVGDWVINTITNEVEQIIEITKCEYICSGTLIVSFDNQHLLKKWTIRDAKDGDVLFCKGNIKNSNGIKYERICLFNNLDNAFFTVTKLSSNSIEEYAIDVNIDYPDNTVPATKEQKEILFMVMKEAGYEWDSEKKKLKKIENEIEIPFGAKDSELQEETYYIPKGFHAEIDGDKVVIKKGEKPTAWSEEDTKMFVNIKACLRNANKDYSREIDWLKSIKPQPKNEWSKEDDIMKQHCHQMLALLRPNSSELTKDIIDNCHYWLKSLKDRVQPQSN